MQFESRVFRLPKDVEHPEQDQDACRVEGLRGLAAIADGVTSGIFSRLWAKILTDAVVSDTPNPQDPESFARWLTLRREAWAAQIDVSRLTWFQKPKLREGAFSTLLWVRLLPDEQAGDCPDFRAAKMGLSPSRPHDAQPDAWRLHGFAVGDSCLFWVRGGQVLCTFPIQQSAELEANPIVVGSVDLNRDQLLEFKTFDRPCLRDDLIVLCTDAVAGWALRLQESGQAPVWETYWTMPEEAWREEILRLRVDRQMRVDDATLVLLRVAEKPAPQPPADQSPGGQAAGEQGAGEQAWNDKIKTFSDKVTRFAAGLARRWPRP